MWKFATKVLLFFDICKRERDFFTFFLHFDTSGAAVPHLGSAAGVTPRMAIGGASESAAEPPGGS